MIWTGKCKGTGAGWGQPEKGKTIARVPEESGQVHDGPVLGQDQCVDCRVWHLIGVRFRAGQDRRRSWAVQIHAETGSGQG